jgi:hypothetical protein
MTSQAVLAELLHRLKAQQGAAVYIGGRELSDWPTDAVEALKSARLLVKARPASRLECPGCERQCDKSVELYPAEGARSARAYIICDEPEDMGRIHLALADLEQWRVSGDASPASVAQALGVPLLTAVAGAQPSRQSRRDAAIMAKYEELARAGKRNYVKEIQRTVPGAESLSDRRIRDIVKGR